MKRRSTALQSKERPHIEVANEKPMPFLKIVPHDNLLTPHPLPTETTPQIRLKKQSNFISQLVDLA